MSTSNKKNVCDTCVLLVDYTDITITELGRFKPNPQILWDMQGAEAVTCYNFATREEQQQHYYPRLSLSSVLRHGGFSVKLKIEFPHQSCCIIRPTIWKKFATPTLKMSSVFWYYGFTRWVLRFRRKCCGRHKL